MKTILLSFCVMCLLFTGYTLQNVDYSDYHTHTVVVNNGESLWEIASRHANGQEDVREVMYRISRANDLKSKYVYPGQVLKVPVRAQSDGLMMAGK